MVYGIVVAMAASVIGALYTRRRRDLAGAWWLKFWQRRAGTWAARLAGVGLRLRPVPKALPPKGAKLEAPAAQLHLPRAGLQQIRKWLAASHTFETNERD